MSTFYTIIPSPLGDILLAGNPNGLAQISFQEGSSALLPAPNWQEDESTFAEVRRQLNAYFTGELHHFDLPLAPKGTPFQQTVWQTLQTIPYGTTSTYGELASKIGNPKASRAVGAANGRNPIPIIIPCHRVIGANGKLTGFRGGLQFKEALLSLEGYGRIIQTSTQLDLF